ncbi:zf-HC2 domain-containing protein [Cellulomonas soli]
MSHLGSRISALVDGQLDPASTERALAHVAMCRACTLELGQARAARRALAEAADVVPVPAPDLTSRLLSLATQCPPDVPGDPFAAPSPRMSGPLGDGAYTIPLRGLRGDVTVRSRARLARGALAGAGAVAAALFVLGARPAVVPSSHPGAALGLLGGAAATEGSTVDALAGDAATPTGTETAAWLRSH